MQRWSETLAGGSGSLVMAEMANETVQVYEWWQIAFLALLALLTVALAAGWYRYSIASGTLHRLGELYLWIAPVFGLALLGLIHERAGLGILLAGVAAIHLAVIAAALWALGGMAAFRVSPGPLASALLILGSVIFWMGVVTWPTNKLESIAAHPANQWATTVLFLLAALTTLAGFAVLSTVLCESGDRILSQLGLISFLVAIVFWALHLAFRVTVVLHAAEQIALTGAAPPWFEPLRAWAELMFDIYMVMAYLAIAAYGAAMRKTGWAGKAWGRAFVVFGLVAAVGFVAGLRPFHPPLNVQLAPYAMGMLILRRAAQRATETRDAARAQ